MIPAFVWDLDFMNKYPSTYIMHLHYFQSFWEDKVIMAKSWNST